MSKSYKVVFALSAEMEILSIYAYILNDSVKNAENWLNKLQEACQSLSMFPERNPKFRFVSAPSRQMIFNHNIRIIYTIFDDTVAITHCYRCEQNITEPL
ncbi:MAG: type II toxin-antitoxin system RelE/ParE family toxin [Azospirillum sp.]|nr:type II toxin-antitoxin system RelE/ParE family toxin [Azospirillum sp.]